MVNHFEFVFSMYMVENMASWLMKLKIEKICYTWQWLLVFELWSIVLNFFFLEILLKNLASWLMNLITERMGFTFWLFLIYIVLLKLPVPMVCMYKDWTSRILMMNLCYNVLKVYYIVFINWTVCCLPNIFDFFTNTCNM